MTAPRPGPRNALTDVAGLAVGNAEDDRLKSGVTVVVCDRPTAAAVDVMGGAPGTRETELLAPERLVGGVDALVLSGGSAFGLAAADGVMAGLRARGRGFAVAGQRVPIVPAAILFDLANGGAKDWQDNPYPTLGRAALDAAGADFALGSVGAGTGAVAGAVKGGLGSASLVMEDGGTVAALVAVNSVGSAVHPDGRLFAGLFEIGAEMGGLGPPGGPMAAGLPPGTKLVPGPGAATTIAVVATDATLDKAGCRRLAIAAQDGLGRAVVPAHTPMDGDLVFALATGRRPAPPDPAALTRMAQGVAACLTRAIGRALYHAQPAPRDRVPCWRPSGTA